MKVNQKFYITHANFLRWYFNSGSDDEILETKLQFADMIISMLKNEGTIHYNVSTLFNETDTSQIPYKYFEPFNFTPDEEVREIKETMPNIEIELIEEPLKF